MRKLIFLLMWPVFLTGAATAQFTATGEVHWCGTPHERPEAVFALQSFQKAKAAGLLPRAALKTTTTPVIGDRRNFNEVKTLSGSITSPSNYAPQEYELRDITDRYYLWVRVTELQNGNVTESEISGLRDQMVTSTPPGSYDPAQGILENISSLYGEPPDYDGDGMLDILMFDIDPDAQGSSTVGFVSPVDVFPDAPEGVGNQADVLYLDSKQGTANPFVLAWIAAHEYVHLVHFTYGSDTYTWISEGLAELGSMANGYVNRNYSYLNDASETSLALFEWRSSLDDYRRAGLFYRYLAEQVGLEAVTGMVRSQVKGTNNLVRTLRDAGSSFSEQLSGFHSANLINDSAVSARFAHDLLGPRLSAVNPESGRQAFATEEGGLPSRTIQPAAVRYLRYENVRDISFTIDAVGLEIQLPEFRKQYSVRAFMYSADGAVSFQDLVLQPGATVLNGDYERVDLVIAHLDPDLSFPSRYGLAVEWDEVTATSSDDVQDLPSTVSLAQNYPNPFNPSTTVTFEVPTVSDVRLAVFDLLGREVAVLADGLLDAGRHEVRFDAGSLPSGSYLYRLETSGSVLTRVLTLTR